MARPRAPTFRWTQPSTMAIKWTRAGLDPRKICQLICHNHSRQSCQTMMKKRHKWMVLMTRTLQMSKSHRYFNKTHRSTSWRAPMVNQGREEVDRTCHVALVNRRTVKVKIRYINQLFSMWMRWLIRNKRIQKTENRTRQWAKTFRPTSWPWINTSMGRSRARTLLKYLDAEAQRASSSWVIGLTTQGTIKDRHLVKISRVSGSKCKKHPIVCSIFNHSHRRKVKAIHRRSIRLASTMSLILKNISAQSSPTKFKKVMERTIRRRQTCQQNVK